jgi:hypothetical protein
MACCFAGASVAASQGTHVLPKAGRPRSTSIATAAACSTTALLLLLLLALLLLALLLLVLLLLLLSRCLLLRP